MQNNQPNYYPISSEMYSFEKIPITGDTFKSLDYRRILPSNNSNITESNDNNYYDYSHNIPSSDIYTHDNESNTNSDINSDTSGENSDLCGHKYPQYNFTDIYSVRT